MNHLGRRRPVVGCVEWMAGERWQTSLSMSPHRAVSFSFCTLYVYLTLLHTQTLHIVHACACMYMHTHTHTHTQYLPIFPHLLQRGVQSLHLNLSGLYTQHCRNGVCEREEGRAKGGRVKGERECMYVHYTTSVSGQPSAGPVTCGGR